MEPPTSKKIKKNHLRGQTTRGTSIKFLNPPPVERNISNKEREGPPERMTSLKRTLTYCNSTSQNRGCLHTL
jgi:hypothetical protein